MSALLAQANFSAPSIEYSQVAPLLIVFGGAVAGVLIEAFLPRRVRYVSQLVLALVSLIAAFAGMILLHTVLKRFHRIKQGP